MAAEGVDPRLACAAVVGFAGIVVVVLALASPSLLGRAVASKAHSIKVSKEHSQGFLSLGMSLVVAGIGYAVTRSETVLVLLFVAGALVFRLVGPGRRHAA
jgi:hypothetical protein